MVMAAPPSSGCFGSSHGFPVLAPQDLPRAASEEAMAVKSTSPLTGNHEPAVADEVVNDKLAMPRHPHWQTAVHFLFLPTWFVLGVGECNNKHPFRVANNCCSECLGSMTIVNLHLQTLIGDNVTFLAVSLCTF